MFEPVPDARVDPEPITYEQPLNERMRGFMRLEFLWQQLSYHASVPNPWSSRSAVAGLLEILATTPELEAFVLNTGRVGGEGDGSKKVSIAASSAMVQGIVEGTIEWEIDPDFGYEVAVSVPGVDDPDLLRPRLLYQSLGRGQEYRTIVDRLKAERVAYLTGYRGLDPEILAGLHG